MVEYCEVILEIEQCQQVVGMKTGEKEEENLCPRGS